MIRHASATGLRVLQDAWHVLMKDKVCEGAKVLAGKVRRVDAMLLRFEVVGKRGEQPSSKLIGYSSGELFPLTGCRTHLVRPTR